MNGLHYLRAAIFTTKTSFSRLPYFLSHIREEFINLPFEYDAVMSKLEKTIRQFESQKRVIDQEQVLLLLMAEDLRLIKQSLQSNRKLIEDDTHFYESLMSCRDQSLHLLNDLGFTIAAPDIFIVDNFPPPYDRASFAAISPDAFDEQLYGIPIGIYFLKQSLCPIYSRFLLTHEIIHSVLGQSSPEYMGRGLEEGIAEIVGALYLGSRVLGSEITRTTFYHNRLGYGIEQFWQLYLDYTRMGTYIYHRFGMEGLITMLKEGRRKIKEVESLCFQGKYCEINLPSGKWLDDVTDLVSYIALTFSRDFVVSPFAYYAARYINEKDTVSEIAEKSGLNVAMVESIIKELQDRVFVLLASDGRVDMSDVRLLLSSGAMRYEVESKE